MTARHAQERTLNSHHVHAVMDRVNAADDLLKTALKQARNLISARSVINGNHIKSCPWSSVWSIRLVRNSHLEMEVCLLISLGPILMDKYFIFPQNNIFLVSKCVRYPVFIFECYESKIFALSCITFRDFYLFYFAIL